MLGRFLMFQTVLVFLPLMPTFYKKKWRYGSLLLSPQSDRLRKHYNKQQPLLTRCWCSCALRCHHLLIIRTGYTRSNFAHNLKAAFRLLCESHHFCKSCISIWSPTGMEPPSNPKKWPKFQKPGLFCILSLQIPQEARCWGLAHWSIATRAEVGKPPPSFIMTSWALTFPSG